MNETHPILSQSVNNLRTKSLSTNCPWNYGHKNSLFDGVFTPCIPNQYWRTSQSVPSHSNIILWQHWLWKGEKVFLQGLSALFNGVQEWTDLNKEPLVAFGKLWNDSAIAFLHTGPSLFNLIRQWPAFDWLTIEWVSRTIFTLLTYCVGSRMWRIRIRNQIQKIFQNGWNFLESSNSAKL